MKQPNSEMTVEDAARVLRAQMEERVRACSEDLQAVLAKHNCGLAAVAIIEGDRVRSEVRIVPQ